MDLIDLDNIKTVIAYRSRRSLCCIKGKAEFIVFLGDGSDLVFVGIAHCDEYAAVFFHLIACGDKSLIQSFLKGICNTEDFAGGFHFRTELVINIDKLLEGEYRNLYGNIG